MKTKSNRAVASTSLVRRIDVGVVHRMVRTIDHESTGYLFRLARKKAKLSLREMARRPKSPTLQPASEASASTLCSAIGVRFDAWSGNHYREWEIESEVTTDAFGEAFVWARIVADIRVTKRTPSRVKTRYVWHLNKLPPETIKKYE